MKRLILLLASFLFLLAPFTFSQINLDFTINTGDKIYDSNETVKINVSIINREMSFSAKDVMLSLRISNKHYEYELDNIKAGESFEKIIVLPPFPQGTHTVKALLNYSYLFDERFTIESFGSFKVRFSEIERFPRNTEVNLEETNETVINVTTETPEQNLSRTNEETFFGKIGNGLSGIVNFIEITPKLIFSDKKQDAKLQEKPKDKVEDPKSITLERFQKIVSRIEGIQNFPSKTIILIDFFDRVGDQAKNIDGLSFVIGGGGKVSEGTVSDYDAKVTIGIYYIEEMENNDPCSVIKDFVAKKDFFKELKISWLSLGWKYKGVIHTCGIF